MEGFWQYAHEHPYLAWSVLVLGVTGALNLAGTLLFRLPNRLLRHLNIRAEGWPPEHCDADSDIRIAHHTDVEQTSSHTPEGDLMPRPFHCGSQFADWQDRNCYRCKKFNEEAPSIADAKCEIDVALAYGYWFMKAA